MLCLPITIRVDCISTKVFIETLRINFLAISHMNKRYGPANLRIELVGISETSFLLVILKPVQRFSL